MKKVIVIPARYASTRLPGKPLLDIGGKTLLQRVYEEARRSRLADTILIATDDQRIAHLAQTFGAEAVITDPSLPSGTDRVFAAVQGHGADLIINLQGDEPFIDPAMIDRLFSALQERDVEMATLCCPLTKVDEYQNPNTVKVVLNKSGFALYFSRAPIPHIAAPNSEFRTPQSLFKHIGVYAFTRSFLKQFVSMPKSSLEEAESLEQLRVLENGYPIRVLVTEYRGFGIDTPEDLERARKLLAK